MFKKLKAKIADRKIKKMLKGAKITSEGERLLSYLKDIQNDKADYYIKDFDDYIDALIEETGESKKAVVAATITIYETIKEISK